MQMGRAMSKIALHLSKCRVTSCLVVLLMGLSSMVFGQEPTPGKYVCDIANIVGLQTSSAERQQKFFVTIEDNKQLPEDWCFSADALDDLKKAQTWGEAGHELQDAVSGPVDVLHSLSGPVPTEH